MLHDVAVSALGRIGYSAEAAADIVRDLDAELQKAPAGLRDCGVHFRVDAGTLVIVLTVPGLPEWRLTRPLPAPD